MEHVNYLEIPVIERVRRAVLGQIERQFAHKGTNSANTYPRFEIMNIAVLSSQAVIFTSYGK